MKIYHYHPATKQYLGEGKARLSPLDSKQGREVYLIPKYTAKISPPEIPENKMAVLTGDRWELEDIPPASEIVIVLLKKLDSEELLKTVQAVFPGSRIKSKVSLDQEMEKEVVFEGVLNTNDNRGTLQAIIKVHDYEKIMENRETQEKNIDKLPLLERATLLTLLDRVNIDIDAFRKEVKQKYDELKAR